MCIRKVSTLGEHLINSSDGISIWAIFFQVIISLPFTLTQYFYSTYTRFIGEFIVGFFAGNKIVSLFLFFITFQNIKVFWNCACEENKLLKQWIEHRESLLFQHVYTQTRTHKPLAHLVTSRHNICAQFMAHLGSLFILGTIAPFFKSIIPVTTANLMYNLIVN